jgi:histone H3/H4
LSRRLTKIKNWVKKGKKYDGVCVERAKGEIKRRFPSLDLEKLRREKAERAAAAAEEAAEKAAEQQAVAAAKAAADAAAEAARVTVLQQHLQYQQQLHQQHFDSRPSIRTTQPYSPYSIFGSPPPAEDFAVGSPSASAVVSSSYRLSAPPPSSIGASTSSAFQVPAAHVTSYGIETARPTDRRSSFPPPPRTQSYPEELPSQYFSSDRPSSNSTTGSTGAATSSRAAVEVAVRRFLPPGYSLRPVSQGRTVYDLPPRPRSLSSSSTASSSAFLPFNTAGPASPRPSPLFRQTTPLPPLPSSQHVSASLTGESKITISYRDKPPIPVVSPQTASARVIDIRSPSPPAPREPQYRSLPPSTSFSTHPSSNTTFDDDSAPSSLKPTSLNFLPSASPLPHPSSTRTSRAGLPLSPSASSSPPPSSLSANPHPPTSPTVLALKTTSTAVQTDLSPSSSLLFNAITTASGGQETRSHGKKRPAFDSVLERRTADFEEVEEETGGERGGVREMGRECFLLYIVVET